MNKLQLHIDINPQLYLRNPETTELGRNIVGTSIELINELGFEGFTFKKLGIAIGSNESSVYRYFESKHALLVYLISWYWSWIEYKIVFATTNIPSAETRLLNCIKIITEDITKDNSFSFINEVSLHKIIITESSKAYHTKDIDKENEKGYYKTYKRVVQRISEIVLELNSAFEYPNMLISTVIEGAHHQRFFSEHLPSLTNVSKGENSITKFYKKLVLNTIKTK